MEDFDWLILQTLYEKKNITKTGKDLFISQPTITSRLQKIEKEFGIQIVYRGAKGVNFTPQGEYLAVYAKNNLASLRKVKEHVLNMEQKVAGTLRLGASKFFTKYKLPGILKQFRDIYPDVEFKVNTVWSYDILNLINTKEVYVGFIRGDYNWSEQKQLLFEEPMVIASKTPIEFKQLPHLPRIDYRTDPFVKAEIENWWREHYSLPPNISMEVDTVDTCREMVVNGLGYAIMPGMILKGLDINKVELVNKDGNIILRKTWMLYLNESLELTVVKAFIDFVKNYDFYNS